MKKAQLQSAVIIVAVAALLGLLFLAAKSANLFSIWSGGGCSDEPGLHAIEAEDFCVGLPLNISTPIKAAWDYNKIQYQIKIDDAIIFNCQDNCIPQSSSGPSYQNIKTDVYSFKDCNAHAVLITSRTRGGYVYTKTAVWQVTGCAPPPTIPSYPIIPNPINTPSQPSSNSSLQTSQIGAEHWYSSIWQFIKNLFSF